MTTAGTHELARFAERDANLQSFCLHTQVAGRMNQFQGNAAITEERDEGKATSFRTKD